MNGSLGIRFLLLLMLLLVSQPAKAGSPADPECQKFLALLQSRHELVTDLPLLPRSGKTSVSFKMNPRTGGLENVCIQESIGNQDIDFSCLEATYSIAPLKAFTDYQAVLEFSRPFQKVPNESMKAGRFSFHRIPLSILFVYPELYKRTELTGIANICVLEVDDFKTSKSILHKIYKAWFRFFHEHKDATKGDIERMAEKLIHRFKCRMSDAQGVRRADSSCKLSVLE